MELTYRLIEDTGSFEAFRSLLKASSLPADDLDFKRDLLVGYYEGDELVGTEAEKRKLRGIYLLTETAHGFFQKKGFKDVARNEVPEEIKRSAEFSVLCSESAAVMCLELTGH